MVLDGSYMFMGQLLALSSCVPSLPRVPLALPQFTPLKADQWSKDLLPHSFVHI